MNGNCTVKAHLPIAAIHGTHERRTKESVNPIQLLESMGYLINAHANAVIFEKEINGAVERVAVHGLGGVPDSYAKEAIKAINYKPVPNAFNIFVFHQTVKEFVPVDLDVMSIEDLPIGFDLYLCGHIHKRFYDKELKFLMLAALF